MQKIKAMVDEKTQKNIDAWLDGPFDEAIKDTIRQLKQNNPEELTDAFYKNLEFGTGGLRGIMGIGTNRMNEFTVALATQGLANYLKKQNTSKNLSVLVGFDTRKNSRKFAEETAKILAGNGIEVFLYKEFRPVALISFGVLYKKCAAGVMITASHNPPEYNGYKVWWKDGVQVTSPHDQGIIDEVNKITSFDQVKKGNFPNPLIKEVAEEIDQAYLKTIHKLALHPGNDSSKGKDLHIVYTNIHGGGIAMVPPALKSWGFTKLTFVEEQKSTDGTFPTVKSPNPEEKGALALGVDTLKKVHGDILIGTDPDCDRLAVVVMHENAPFYFNGNELGCMLLEHICRSLQDDKKIPPKPIVIKTIVTTELIKAICDHYGIMCLDVLTGFKYIGEKMAQWEEEQAAHVTSHHFIFGAEESYGYLYGTQARDKDAVISCCLVAEMALQLKLQGKTLVDFLYDLYKKYGVYREKLLSLTFEGKEGQEKMKNLMKKLREHPPKTLDSASVVTFEDYSTHTNLHLESGKTEPLVLPKSNVLRFFLSDHTKIVVRPSGTEPKMKIYVGCVSKHHIHDKQTLEKAIKDCDIKAEIYIAELKKLLS